MYYPFHYQNLPSHQPRKSVFVSGKNEQKVNCSLLDLFQHKGIPICSEEQKLLQISPRKGQKPQDMTPTKLSKKSLKSHSKFNDFFQSTVKKEKANIKQFQAKTQKTVKKVQDSGHELSRQPSKVFSKTASSEMGYNALKKPAACYSQMGQNSYKCSSQNIINSSFQKGTLSQSCKLEKQRLSHIPMVQSLGKNTIEGLTGMRQSKQVRPFMNPEVFNFQKVKFVNSISQSLDMLGISPVKQIVIPEVSQKSGLNSQYPTERQDLSISQKMEFKAPPEIKKITSEEYSQFFRTTPNMKIEDSIKQSIPLETVQEVKKSSKIVAYDQSKVEFRVEERDFLEISLEKQQQEITYEPSKKSMIGSVQRFDEFNQGEKDKSVHSYQGSQGYHEEIRDSQVKNSKIHSTSSKVFSGSGQQILAQQQMVCQVQLYQQEPYASKQVFNEVLQSQKQSNQQKSDEQQESQVEQKKQQTTKLKAPKLQHIPFSRHSLQIPRSKKFSDMKVKRTVSMRDQEESQDEETSQVIYGFRKTHKEAIMEDINQDMQESCVTRTQHNLSNNINLSDFRQLLM